MGDRFGLLGFCNWELGIQAQTATANMALRATSNCISLVLAGNLKLHVIGIAGWLDVQLHLLIA
jgi:hypothetical protein